MDILGSDNDDADDQTFTINDKYAQKYTERKKMEELGELKHKYGKGSSSRQGRPWETRNEYGDDGYDDDDEDDSDDEPEDEHGELVTPQVDAQIMKTIAMLRAKRPEVYDPTTTFFSDTDMEAAQKKWQEKKKAVKEEGKPMFLKDYHRKELLAKVDEDDEDGVAGRNDDSVVGASMKDANPTSTGDGSKTHVQEQAELKAAFKAAIASTENANGSDDDDGDELLTARPRSKEEIEAEDREYSKFLLENMNVDAVGDRAWNDFKDANYVDEKDVFLMDYILNRGWVDKDAKRLPTYEEVVDEEDETHVEVAEQFEHKYNFRFEESEGTQIATFARNIDGVVRRKDDSRKRKRDDLKLRKAEEKQRKQEELKRLKNLKMEELRQKLKKIRDMAGGESIAFGEVDLEKEFDPNEHDQLMQKTFDESYYAAEDAWAKPKFDDDIDVADIAGKIQPAADEDEHEDGHEDGHEDAEALGHGNGDAEFVMDADYAPGGEHYETIADAPKEAETKKLSKKERKRLERAARAAKGKAKGMNMDVDFDADMDTAEGIPKEKMSLGEYLDEYYRLDYEDLIGDLPTRFKYRQVEPVDFGLKPEEILEADDAHLNQFLSLKKLAPYRRPDVVEKDMQKWRKSKKKRLWEFRQQLRTQKAKAQEGGSAASDQPQQAADASTSRKSMSAARLASFGIQDKKK